MISEERIISPWCGRRINWNDDRVEDHQSFVVLHTVGFVQCVPLFVIKQTEQEKEMSEHTDRGQTFQSQRLEEKEKKRRTETEYLSMIPWIVSPGWTVWVTRGFIVEVEDVSDSLLKTLGPSMGEYEGESMEIWL